MARRIAVSKRKGWLRQAKTGIRRFLFKASKPKRAYKRRRKVMPRHAMKTRKFKYKATLRHNCGCKKNPLKQFESFCKVVPRNECSDFPSNIGSNYKFAITINGDFYSAFETAKLAEQKCKEMRAYRRESIKGHKSTEKSFSFGRGQR